MQMVKCMILVAHFIACHAQTIHLSITTTIGCYGTNIGGRRCSLFDYSGREVSTCLVEDCVTSTNPFLQTHIRRCDYGYGLADCVPIIFEFQIPKSKQNYLGKCPQRKIALNLEERVMKFEYDTYRILPINVEISSSGKANSVPEIRWYSDNLKKELCPIAPSANGISPSAPQCSLIGESYSSFINGLDYDLAQVDSVKLRFLDDKTKSVIPMPANQCPSSTAVPTTPPQTSRDKLLEYILIQSLFNVRGAHPSVSHFGYAPSLQYSRGVYPSFYNSNFGSAPSFAYSNAGYPSAPSVPSTTGIRRP